MVSSSASGGTTLTYDPLGRLWQTASQTYGITQFVYDGAHFAVEYDGANNVRRRFFWGPTQADEPILEDEGARMDCSGTQFLHTDERGSVVASADCFGNRTHVNSYDEHGIPGGDAWGRFGYTGQAWIPDVGMWFYKARMYSPSLGRFMQTDPIGYGDGLNWYAYAHGDAVNGTDPSGTKEVDDDTPMGDGGGGGGNGGDYATSYNPPPTRTGSLIPGVIPDGLQINGLDAQAAQMAWNNSNSNDGFYVKEPDNTTRNATPAEIQSARDNAGGYNQDLSGGGEKWTPFPSTSSPTSYGSLDLSPSTSGLQNTPGAQGGVPCAPGVNCKLPSSTAWTPAPAKPTPPKAPSKPINMKYILQCAGGGLSYAITVGLIPPPADVLVAIGTAPATMGNCIP